MRRINISQKGLITVNKTVEGEMLEDMIKRAVTEMTPIEENAPIIYTPRKDGVKAEYNIRTDRMDIALEAATAYNEHYYGQRKEYYKEPEKSDADGNDKGDDGGNDKGNE